MSHEETFSRDITADEALNTRLLRLVTSLAAELRADGLAAGCVTVKLRDHDFKTRQASRTPPRALRTDRALFGIAQELLAGLRSRRRVAARLLGVAFSSLTANEGPAQLSLLTPQSSSEETVKDRELATAVDRINKKLGEQSIGPARLVKSGGRRSPSPPP